MSKFLITLMLLAAGLAPAAAAPAYDAAAVARIHGGIVDCPGCNLAGADLTTTCVKAKNLTGANFGRDLPEPAQIADFRNVVNGDPSPDGKGVLELCRGIEVGHIFQLRTKYSAALKCNYLDEKGAQTPMEMGCYGIGITRIVAAAIEQNHDERGIMWPRPIAPFDIAIVPIGLGKSEAVRAAAEKLHDELTAVGLEVLLDDRDERPGVMFADMELTGIPHRVVIGDRGLKQNQLEYQARSDKAAQPIALDNAAEAIQKLVCGG